MLNSSPTIAYVLLSPTFGMHQYTADLANRFANGGDRGEKASEVVGVITTTTTPRDRYAPNVSLVTPITTHNTGFSNEGLQFAAYRAAQSAILRLQPSVVHFTGVHAWNVPLVYALRRRGVKVIHSLHDLDPHGGVRFAALIRLWNRLILASGAHILVHGECYRDRLLRMGLSPARVTVSPLLHGFLSGREAWPPHYTLTKQHDHRYHIRNLHVLFFGRVEQYKGVSVLLQAWEQMLRSAANGAEPRLTIAGARSPRVNLPPLPPGVTLLEGRVEDAEAGKLFRGADLLVLPYLDATQSALIGAAYAYGVPVLATKTGALSEYVIEAETGWLVEPGSVADLAAGLTHALADPHRLIRMGDAARNWFAEHRAAETATLSAMYAGVTPRGS